jgi:spore maturation protein SpmA
MNWIFLGLLVVSVSTGAFSGSMKEVTQAAIGSAKTAVELAIGLVGQMTLWLGFMGILRESGLLGGLSRLLRPLLRRLFPEVPDDHPAMGAMILNMAANILGLGNAATPFGLKAMQELDTLNPRKGVATNSMAMFLALNTGGMAVLPLSAIAVRAAVGSSDPAGIIIPTLLATSCATVGAVLVCLLLQNRPAFAVTCELASPAQAAVRPPVDASALAAASALAEKVPLTSRWRRIFARGALALVLAGVLLHVAGTSESRSAAEALYQRGFVEVVRELSADWLLPLLMFFITVVGFSRGVRVYEAFIAAAKEGFQTGITVIPYLVAILVSVGMLRASGALRAIVMAIGPALSPLGFPPEALPMALIRPLSGSGALAVMTDLLKAHGPDSFIGYLASVLNGSTETTFYVLALYFGCVQVRSFRHTVWACVAADLVGPLAALAACRIFISAP